MCLNIAMIAVAWIVFKNMNLSPNQPQ